MASGTAAAHALKQSITEALGGTITVPGTAPALSAQVLASRPRYDPARRIFILIGPTVSVIRTPTGYEIRQQLDAFSNDPTGHVANAALGEAERILTEREKGPGGSLLPYVHPFAFTEVRLSLGISRLEPAPDSGEVYHAAVDLRVRAQDMPRAGERF